MTKRSNNPFNIVPNDFNRLKTYRNTSSSVYIRNDLPPMYYYTDVTYDDIFRGSITVSQFILLDILKGITYVLFYFTLPTLVVLEGTTKKLI